MDKIKDKLTKAIEALNFKHSMCLNDACNATNDYIYTLRINDANFIEGQITMAKEVLKWIKIQ